jgi:hypothetical protein
MMTHKKKNPLRLTYIRLNREERRARKMRRGFRGGITALTPGLQAAYAVRLKGFAAERPL